MSDRRWFELLPRVEHETWAHGKSAREDLVEVQAPQSTPWAKEWPAQFLSKDAAFDYMMMRHAAKMVGISLWIRYAWRSHELQHRFWNEWKSGARKLKPAPPGYSLHQSGKAIDILRSHDAPLGAEGPTDIWLYENGRQFGWRKPKALAQIEPWHYAWSR